MTMLKSSSVSVIAPNNSSGAENHKRKEKRERIGRGKLCKTYKSPKGVERGVKSIHTHIHSKTEWDVYTVRK